MTKDNIFSGNAELFREMPKTSFKNFGKNLAPPFLKVWIRKCVLLMAELLDILGLHNRSSQQLKSEVAEKQETVHKFVQQCCFFESEARTSKFADQADNIASFTNPLFSQIKDQLKS